MALTEKNYKNRLIDLKIKRYLNVFGAICIEGPKWCGKTWTSLNHANSVVYITDKESRNLAKINPKYIFNDNKPQLIDEWQLVPEIWDSVRHECDSVPKKGNFILTGSTTLRKDDKNQKVFHSGAGRIARLKMYTMSLYESGNSTGDVSIMDMYNNTVNCKYIRKIELTDLAQLIIRGGWPANMENVNDEDASLIPKNYIQSIIESDMNDGENKVRDGHIMMMILRSLARNESTIAGSKTIVKDIENYENEEELVKSRTTISDYIDVLNRLHLIENQEAFSINYRSSNRVGKSSKRHFTDPSLACALLNLSCDKLMKDLKTFGLLFEALVERDLRIYMDYLDGKLYHFRDNNTGDEVDAIIEFNDGEYGAIEIKLSSDGVSDAKKSLMKFYDNVQKKPRFMCIIVGYYEAVIQDPETGIYILPITSLKA